MIVIARIARVVTVLHLHFWVRRFLFVHTQLYIVETRGRPQPRGLFSNLISFVLIFIVFTVCRARTATDRLLQLVELAAAIAQEIPHPLVIFLHDLLNLLGVLHSLEGPVEVFLCCRDLRLPFAQFDRKELLVLGPIRVRGGGGWTERNRRLAMA